MLAPPEVFGRAAKLARCSPPDKLDSCRIGSGGRNNRYNYFAGPIGAAVEDRSTAVKASHPTTDTGVATDAFKGYWVGSTITIQPASRRR